MTSDQFESYGKSLVFQNIMKREDLDEQEKMKLAEKTLQDIVKKQLDEINNKRLKHILTKYSLANTDGRRDTITRKWVSRGRRDERVLQED